MHFDALNFAHGGPIASGCIRTRPEDFVVREILGFEASKEGEHLLLIVRKRGANTKWVAKQIAEAAGLRVREVGFAGLKDRHAVTEQAFTVRSKESPEHWLRFKGEGFEVIAADRQRRKLRRGAHRGNEFEIVVREFDADPKDVEMRMTAIREFGVPNYFGEQRFGHLDRNLIVAQSWLCDGVSPIDRDERSFALSAARSALFNAVLSERVRLGNWNRMLEGEVANLEGTGSVFLTEARDESLMARCERFDVHPTGPLCGVGDSRVSGEARALEERALLPWAAWREGLVRINVEQQRRALRLAVGDLKWEYANQTLTLKFRLFRGAFATAVLRELMTTARGGELAGANYNNE